MQAPDAKPQCQHIELATSHIGHVQTCPDCGVIHLVLNHLTLRFAPDAFRELTYMLATAQIKLGDPMAALPPQPARDDVLLH